MKPAKAASIMIPILAITGVLLLVVSQAASKSKVTYDVTSSELSRPDTDAFGGSYIEFTTKDISIGTNASYYGNAHIMYSLGDTEPGGNYGQTVAHTIRAPRSGTIDSFRSYLIYIPDAGRGDCSPGGSANVAGDCYHRGDGGTLQFTLESDDGTSKHNPSGNVLASTGNIIAAPELYKGSGPSDAEIYGQPGDDYNFRRFSFNTPVEVEAGEIYHLVMRNTSRDSKNNFTSIDDIVLGSQGKSEFAPKYDPDVDFAVKWEWGEGWQVRDRHVAIGEYFFTDGTGFGIGYMGYPRTQDGPGRASHYLNPSQSVRQTFAPHSDIEINSINIAAFHVSGNNSIQAVLKSSNGAELASTTITGYPTDGVTEYLGNKPRFKGAAISPVDLKANQEYYLELYSEGGTHVTIGARDGSQNYGFSKYSTVLGKAQLKDNNAAWQDWKIKGSTAKDQYDISFYFDLAQ